MLRDLLISIGNENGFLYPWHRTHDPFKILIAEYLLRRTTRTAVSRVYPRLIDRYPTAEDLGEADPDTLWELCRPLGLRKRVLTLPLLAEAIADYGTVPEERAALLELPGVGEYIADAVLLYAHRVPTFPLDAGVQRVLRRLQGLEVADNGPANPYRDRLLRSEVDSLTHGQRPDVLAAMHQGVLTIAWSWCRPAPTCFTCTAKDLCNSQLLTLEQSSHKALAPSDRQPDHPGRGTTAE